MPMVPFYTRFPDLAEKETRVLTVQGWPGFPNGEYGFLELYCDDPKCDCRRVVIWAATEKPEAKIWATINYGWERIEFYERWMRDEQMAQECVGATLDPFNIQTQYSHILLEQFRYILQDQAYVKRLKKHYELFKSTQRKPRKPRARAEKKTKP
ncbi:MAG: hypothetical protein LiPW30_715 [Parcubacteria group bacterium LiPW_30]|nr:MAG: hypothetical protein LiPW30_715 [Parcubacteria group bacterium LiPW_30]